MRETLRVGIIDDESVLSRLVQRLLKTEGIDSEAFPSAESFLESQDSVQEIGCLVVDIRLAGMSGLELQTELRKRKSSVPVVVISGCANVDDVVRAFGNGAAAFFEKPFDNAKLLEAVSSIVNAEEERRSCEKVRDARFSALSERERQVLDSLVLGKGVKEIARELAISPSTVEKHRGSIFIKVRVDSVIELTRLILSGPHTVPTLESLKRTS